MIETESQYHEHSVHDLPPTDTPLSPDERPDQQSPKTQRERHRTMTRAREAESARLPATAQRRMPPEVNRSRRKAVDIKAALLLLQLVQRVLHGVEELVFANLRIEN